MHSRATETVIVTALATAITLVMAGPVLRAPSERVFGNAIAGRHHDPFTVMRQFERPIEFGAGLQPVTDVPGALVARATGGVAAYNWVVLVSFPLAAAAAYLLARHFALTPIAATVAALAYAFSPFHLAHAAYHPHVAQTQWLPLFLLALWRCLDRATPVRVALLVAATVAVSLSNFYGGLIAAVITPAAVGAYWLSTRRDHPHPSRSLAVTVGTLIVLAAAGTAYAAVAGRAVLADPSAYAFSRLDLFRYSAGWASYVMPPVAHPLVGDTVRRVWAASGVDVGIVEQQVSLGWGIVALGAIAVASWVAPHRQPASRAAVPVLVVIAVAAFVCSLSPEVTLGPITLVRPSALLYDFVPMFRSYARFGVVVLLMAALLAGLGLDALRRTNGRVRFAGVVLVALAAAEYAVAPSAMWHAVLPTAAHHWVLQQPAGGRTLDCARLGPESESIGWLTKGRIEMANPATADCIEPDISQRLARAGYAQVIVTRNTAEGEWFLRHPVPDGLRSVARFEDAQVFSVTTPDPAVYTDALIGFFPRERDADWSWRWMGEEAAWTVVNARTQPIVAAVGVELSAFHRPRQMEVRLNGRLVQTLAVDPERRVHEIGPLMLPPGGHALIFHSADAPTVAREVIRNGDPRPLSFAIGAWRWIVREGMP